MVELLAPAGSYESLRAAVNAGADAVYIGGSRFGARAYADNPKEDALLDGIGYCHLHGKKLYMTVNTLLKEEELEQELYSYLLPYYQAGLDGVIVQDFGVVQYLAEHFPGLPVHASTQMTITGCDSVRVLQRHGVTRVVPARAADHRGDRDRGRDLCTWCALLLLFRTVSFQQHDRRQERQPGTLCAAMSASVPTGRRGAKRAWQPEIPSEHEGFVYA